ncbi:MAG: glycosyltransferase [Lachnospiraceae bacterium]|nr:glycosyltransferase [Lachnospiraceae bacterium]
MLPISVCMIAKNEEKYIEECLRRLSLYNWEIIVVDTGSTDQTVEIAKSYTPNVYHFDWVNDFSAARNYSISMAKNDYILIVDCDEYLESNEKTSELLSGLTEQIMPTEIGMIDIYSVSEESTDTSFVHDQVARFFNKNFVHYQGTVHEQLVGINNASLKFIQLPLSFQHMGYRSMDVKKQKAIRNIALLKAELIKESTNPYILFQLGQSYFGLNDYMQALPYFEKALELDVNEQEDYVQTLIESYGYCLLYLQQYSRALELEGIYSIFSKHADFVFLMGLIYMNNALFDRAIEEFLKATTIPSFSVDGVNSYKAFYNIGVIYECMGNKKQAVDYYKKCGDYTPALERLR